MAVAADTPAKMKKAGTGNSDKQQVVIEKAEVPNAPNVIDMTLEVPSAAWISIEHTCRRLCNVE